MIAISPLKKYYRRPDFGNIVAELYSNGAFDRNSEFALRKSTSIFSVTRCQRITHYIERSMKRTQQKKDAQNNSPYLVQLKFKLQLKSEDRPIRKNSTSCKQHLKAWPSVKSRKLSHSLTKKLQAKAPWFSIQIQAFQAGEKKKLKYLLSHNKKLQALRVVKEMSTLQLHLSQQSETPTEALTT